MSVLSRLEDAKTENHGDGGIYNAAAPETLSTTERQTRACMVFLVLVGGTAVRGMNECTGVPSPLAMTNAKA